MIHVYGSYACSHCMDIKFGLEKLKLPHIFLNADSQEYQKFLDDLSVDILPLVQLLDDKGNVVWSKQGKVTLTEIVREVRNGHAGSSANKA